jgi:hypothetical protein
MTAPSVKSVEPVSGAENMRKLSPRGESVDKPGWSAAGYKWLDRTGSLE